MQVVLKLEIDPSVITIDGLGLKERACNLVSGVV